MNLEVIAFYKKNENFYPVLELGMHGMIKKHKLLDIFHKNADDGEAPSLKVSDHEVVLLESTSLLDENFERLFESDLVVISGNSEIFEIVKYKGTMCIDTKSEKDQYLPLFSFDMDENDRLLGISKVGSKYDPSLKEIVNKGFKSE